MYDFASPAHAADYLSDTIIRKPGLGPVYISGVLDENPETDGQDVRLQVYTLPKATGATAIVQVKDLDFRPYDIGMVNLLDKQGLPVDAAYAVRIPARRWKIGLSDIGIQPYPVRLPETSEFHPWIYRSMSTQSSWLVEQSGLNMLKNDYPSYEQSMEYMEPFSRRSCAFTRNFAIDSGGKLFYRWHNDPVGRCMSQPKLYERFDMLQEMLEEDMNGQQEEI